MVSKNPWLGKVEASPLTIEKMQDAMAIALRPRAHPCSTGHDTGLSLTAYQRAKVVWCKQCGLLLKDTEGMFGEVK